MLSADRFPKREKELKWQSFERGSTSLYQWLSLSYMAHAVYEILAGTDWEHIDVLWHFQPPQNVREAKLVPRSEPDHLIEPEAHE